MSARAAEFKQNARKLVYGYRTSDDLAEDSRQLLSKIDVHIDVEAFRIVLAAFVPIPCPCCSELRGIGEFNHYSCACGYVDIHGGSKFFFPKKYPSCIFCGTVRLKDGEFRKCPCIARAIEYLECMEKKQR